MKNYQESVIRILNAYAPGTPGLAKAIEALCRTAEEWGIREGKNQSAQEVCEGLHAGPAKGLKCRTCYEVGNNFAEEEKVQAEIAMVKTSASSE